MSDPVVLILAAALAGWLVTLALPDSWSPYVRINIGMTIAAGLTALVFLGSSA